MLDRDPYGIHTFFIAIIIIIIIIIIIVTITKKITITITITIMIIIHLYSDLSARVAHNIMRNQPIRFGVGFQ